jgi:hypothetical protein
MKVKKIFNVFISSFLILALCLVSPSTVFANSEVDSLTDEQINNNIIFYKPNGYGACNSTTATYLSFISNPASNGDNQSITLSFLLDKGFNANAAYAIVGNLMSESHLNPLILEKKYEENKNIVVDDNFRLIDANGNKTFKGGFGIAQWTSTGRVQNLQTFANNTNGGKVNSLMVQLAFLNNEIAKYREKLNSTSLEEAVFIVYRNYETPASSYQTTADGVDNIQDPKTYANLIAHPELSKAAYKAFTTRLNYAKQAAGISPVDISQIDTETGGSVQCFYGASPYTGDFPQYYQSDSRWGSLMYGPNGIHGSTGTSISESGCGPTSFAMLATALLGREILPSDTADVAGKAGQHAKDSNGNWAGSSWGITKVLAEHYGLQYKNITVRDIGDTVNVINEALNDGWMIHTSGTGAAPFSTGGHYIGIYGRSEDGKWLIADSSRKGNKAYDPTTVVNGIFKRSGMSSYNIKGIKR